MTNDKKGFSMLEVIFGIALFGLIVYTVSNLQEYMLESESASNQETNYYLTITSELSRLYADGWDFTGSKVIETKMGEIEVILTEKTESEHETRVADVTFIYKSLEETYEIERSVYSE